VNADVRGGRTKDVADRKWLDSGSGELASGHLDRGQPLRLLGVEALDLGPLNGGAACEELKKRFKYVI
jgi:hypothetical protein